MNIARSLLGLTLVSGCGAGMMRCTSASGSWAIGRVADQSILDRIKAESGAEQIRTLADRETSSDIGMNRVTVHVNAQNLVTAVTCD